MIYSMDGESNLGMMVLNIKGIMCMAKNKEKELILGKINNLKI